MSNTNNKSLNDLLRSVQAEAKGDILSQSEVERLLPSIERSVPVTQSTQQRLSNNLYERLLSTPLKIGMTAMTTAACITLGLIAFWPTPEQTVNKAPILSHATYGSQGMDGAMQNISQPTANNAPSLNYKSQPNEVIAKIPAQPIATADSLQPVELSPEQLAQLGIVLEDNGDIDFYTRDVSSAKDSHGDSLVYVSHYGLPPTWGLRVHFLAHGLLTPGDIPEIHCLTMMPQLITEPNGSKRLFSFENNGSSQFKKGSFHTKEIKNFTDENGKTDVRPVFDDDSNMNMDINMHFISNGCNQGSAISNSSKADVRTDTIKKVSVMTIVANKVQVGKGGIISNMDFNPDSGETKVSVWDGKGVRLPGGNISDDLQQAENSLDMSKLIPIRVVNTKNADHPNELIFWYELSPELTAAMPAAVDPVPDMQSKQLAISVYPNPTYGAATIHYELSDAPHAYFSVRNLLGQEVQNGGMTSGTTGDASLDLSQLPAGVYLLITTTDNGERDVEQVVVTK